MTARAFWRWTSTAASSRAPATTRAWSSCGSSARGAPASWRNPDSVATFVSRAGEAASATRRCTSTAAGAVVGVHATSDAVVVGSACPDWKHTADESRAPRSCSRTTAGDNRPSSPCRPDHVSSSCGPYLAMVPPMPAPRAAPSTPSASWRRTPRIPGTPPSMRLRVILPPASRPPTIMPTMKPINAPPMAPAGICRSLIPEPDSDTDSLGTAVSGDTDGRRPGILFWFCT